MRALNLPNTCKNTQNVTVALEGNQISPHRIDPLRTMNGCKSLMQNLKYLLSYTSVCHENPSRRRRPWLRSWEFVLFAL